MPLRRTAKPLRGNARVELLSGIPLFTQCTKKDLREIARVAEDVELDAGTVLIREGEPGREFFVVVEGEVEVTRRRGGKVARIGPGDHVGETALLSNRPRNATVTATTPVRLLRIGDADFLELLDRMPLLWLKITGSLADRVPDDDYLRR